MSFALSPRAAEWIAEWGYWRGHCPECGELKIRQPRCSEHLEDEEARDCADCRYYAAHFAVRGCKDHFEIELRHNALEAQEEQRGFSFLKSQQESL